MKPSKYFNAPEFYCPCCKKEWTKDSLIDMLDKIRNSLGKPVDIESGCRCRKHNASLKNSASNSGHITGEAADIYVRGMTNHELYAHIKAIHAKGWLPQLRYCYRIRGTSGTRVHVGVDDKHRANIFG
ncbi:MAG: D-Ala-D-Ala carboxypeptidase family metallohydrolase [Cloacibacillus sp.]